MFTGIFYGLLAAFLQSASYIFSRHFMARHANPVHLLIYSQACMGVFSLLLLPFVMRGELLSRSDYIFPIIICSLAFVFGQLCFFKVIKEIEASVASSLLGLKILMLAILSVAFLNAKISLIQWLALSVCMIAAMMMNGSSKKMNWRAAGWLFLTCLGYAVSDLYIRRIIETMPGPSFVQRVLLGAALSYLLLGILSIPALFMIKRSGSALKCAIPFAICWYLAMIFLFACFAVIGPLFGNIIQSTRGLISIGFGVLIARMGHHHLESVTGRRLFWYRLAAALLMFAAIVTYTLTQNAGQH
ncbi:MAG: hypothetical protein A2X49_10555 [Lentisphaerae bacterium GWF2_52_8]|nr:MAG: hypothetical protein A2X49_10555 [Lentisphaerae bacterium GWF2_52_8]